MNTIARTLGALMLAPLPVLAHVPFVEEADFSLAAPFVVADPENSKAISAQLATPGDVDFYRITLTAPARILFGSNVPYCRQYADFGVTMALFGPGLPQPDRKIPVALSPGDGAIVVRDAPADPAVRPLFYEPNSGRQSWKGPKEALPAVPPGKYTLVVWNEEGRVGDYIAVIGEAERFGPAEIRQVQAAAPKLAHGHNLLVDCDPTRAVAAQSQ